MSMKKVVDKDLFLTVLNSSSTKREAKSYISRFKPSKLVPENSPNKGSRSAGPKTVENPIKIRHGVNLGNFYGSARAVEDSPVFTQGPIARRVTQPDDHGPLHVALVKLSTPQSLNDATLKGIGLTLCQLNQLGLPAAVVIDCGVPEIKRAGQEVRQWRKFITEQADRVVSAIEASGSTSARRVEGIIGASSGIEEEHKRPNWDAIGLHVTSRESVLGPLRRGTIPVITPIAHSSQSRVFIADADAVLLALTKELAGLPPGLFSPDAPLSALDQARALQRQVSVDRLIILDPAGGIPSEDSLRGGHVFINMEQEYEDIQKELQEKWSLSGPRLESQGQNSTQPIDPEPLTMPSDADQISRHLSNLRLLRQALTILPPSSSALLTTPEEAAISGGLTPGPFQASGVGTRRQRNTLIHNLLTDKPPYSSSLPAGRLGLSSDNNNNNNNNPVTNAVYNKQSNKQSVPATFIKRGLPLTLIPDPRKEPWKPPRPGDPKVTLHDPRIDLSRLVELIEDSFNRKLDINHYLSRVNDRIAGVIIAGEYEGGALLTWETPPGLSSDPNNNTTENEQQWNPRAVPYLDKFAVRKRSQGAGGVADIVFTAMVRGCFPQGVCWRSRKDNPVNKWYFERARGTWKLPDTNWTMFWTTEDVLGDGDLFRDYESICRGVEPSWADNKNVVD
ncbi:MAG: Amino-acid acetyltransferase, mitochondrial [Watsoniomyces obsoletus]|nr:MAG: Amino-acid acetyltransferase, mitochondrial [Watsoniomyces obsoletus]